MTDANGLPVSVIVPLHNGPDLVRQCLRSIPSGAPVFVVDDASTDAAPAVVEREFPHVTLLRNERNLGFAATANRGLLGATTPVRVVLNSDARLRPGALEHLVAAFTDPAVGIAGPRLVFPDGSHQTSAAAFPTAARILTGSFLLNELYRAAVPSGRFPLELGMARRDHDHDHDVDWVPGTCLAIREECLDQTGGFDAGYFFYIEDTDLCWRAGQLGWRVRYVSGAVVEHTGGMSGGDAPVQARRLVDGEARFITRAYGPRALPRWRAARVAGGLLKAAVFLVPSAFSARARARFRWQLAASRHALTSARS